MIARQLETIIEGQISKFAISNQPWGHIAQRFESLRAYGLLPKGRVRNSQHLTHEQIASGILSIVASNVGFSGHTALILKALKPVGGAKVSFNKGETFGAALEAILKNEDSALEHLVKVSVSDSEIYTNSHCRCAIHYMLDDQERIAYYVHAYAVSLLCDGAEKDYDPSKITSSVINEIVFYPSFFRSIERSLEHETSMPSIEYPEEPETDDEIERQQRAKYLGITSSSRFLNLGIDCQVTWPRQETLVQFDGYKLVLMPKTREHTTSIHVDLHQNNLTHEQARTVIHRFLSILTWCDDQYAVLQDGWSGNHVPVAVPKRNLAFATTHHWCFDRKKPDDTDTRKAIAIYREGRNAEQNFLVGFAVLSYYKIIEIRHKKLKEKWFRDNYQAVKDKLVKEIRVKFEEHCGDKKVEKYLTVLCRNAVAHAGDPHNIDPDDDEKLGRLYVAAKVLHELARHFIRTEMELSECYFDGS
ncbi:MAG: methylamine utilization protein MauJ [Nitrospirota bacterium]